MMISKGFGWARIRDRDKGWEGAFCGIPGFIVLYVAYIR
jgi:hypothetical protein